MTYFAPEEVAGLDPKLVEMLNRARGMAKVPFVITSGARTIAQNAEAGGAPNSAHLRGLAVDLRCWGNNTRYKMVAALIVAGFNRMVLYLSDGHIHVDIDPNLPTPVLVLKP